MEKNSSVCVSRFYPIDYIKPNRLYIIQYNYSMFIANGNIYVNHSYNDKDNDWKETYICCTVHNFKKWGGMENLKRLVSLKGKKDIKIIADLIDAVMECGYSRKIDYSEYVDIKNDSLAENSDYKYSIDDLVFCANDNLYNGFEKLESPRYGLQIGKYNDTEINFCLDLCMGGIRKDLPECVLKEIEREANRLLEANIVKHEDVKAVKFTCYAKVKLYHNMRKDGRHVFSRSYSLHIEIDKISNYYSELDLSDLDMKFLKHADFHLCDRSWIQKPFDDFIKNELFR